MKTPTAGDSNVPAINFPGTLLLLINPGNFTRHCLMDMRDAAARLGVRTLTIEIGEVWALHQSGQRIDPDNLAKALRDHDVRAALGYTLNGLCEWPCDTGSNGQPRSFFERLGIPHLMWWTDHPHWASEKYALSPELQPLLASPNCRHFVKSAFAADELHDVLGWANCFGLPIAENPDRLRPAHAIAPAYDVVAVMGSPPNAYAAVERFLGEDDPPLEAMLGEISIGVADRLSALWTTKAPRELLTELSALGREWADTRRREWLTASHRIFRRIEPAYPRAARWLRDNYRVYFDAIEALWEFGRWQRTFYVRYLARYFRVGVFGSNWSSVGLGAAAWVNHDDQTTAYADGRIALNVSQAGDEEGIAHKPFEIAAAGVPMLHIHRRGLSDCFTPGVEVEIFDTPREAREKAEALLSDPARRSAMAHDALQRLRGEHTWTHRLAQLLIRAGVAAAKPTSFADEAVSPLRRCPAPA